MVTSFPTANKDGRKMLSVGGVVICIFSKRAIHHDPPADGTDAPDPAVEPVDKWSHIGASDLQHRCIIVHTAPSTEHITLAYELDTLEV